MSLAEHTVIHERKLFAGGQLTAALIAGKARQMEYQVAGSSHPVRGGDAATAFRALGAEISAIKKQNRPRTEIVVNVGSLIDRCMCVCASVSVSV